MVLWYYFSHACNFSTWLNTLKTYPASSKLIDQIDSNVYLPYHRIFQNRLWTYLSFGKLLTTNKQTLDDIHSCSQKAWYECQKLLGLLLENISTSVLSLRALSNRHMRQGFNLIITELNNTSDNAQKRDQNEIVMINNLFIKVPKSWLNFHIFVWWSRVRRRLKIVGYSSHQYTDPDQILFQRSSGVLEIRENH